MCNTACTNLLTRITFCINDSLMKLVTKNMVLQIFFFKNNISLYRSGTVNSKSFVGKVLLRIKWKFELN